MKSIKVMLGVAILLGIINLFAVWGASAKSDELMGGLQYIARECI